MMYRDRWSSSMLHAAGWMAALTLVVTACSPGEETEDVGGGSEEAGDVEDGMSFDIGDGTSQIEDLSVVPNPTNALSYYVEWSTVEAMATDLTVRCGDDWSRTYTGEAERTDHEVFVMGLWEGASCKAMATTDDGATESTTIEPGPLADFLPELTVHTRKPEAVQQGWTFFNLANVFDDIPTIIAAVDHRGRYRWYRQLPTSDTAQDPDIEFLDETILVGGNRRNSGPHELDWEGNVVWTDDVRAHHDIEHEENGQILHYLRRDYDCESGYVQDEIATYSRTTDEITYTWSICDHWRPPEGADQDDWSHFNANEPVHGENAWVLSSRVTSTLFKLDADSDEIAWKMGKYGDFGLTDENRFYKQHAPEIQDNGNILLFDNGAKPGKGDRPWSRAVEIAYDSDTMEAEVVWSYRPDPDIFAPIWGDADRLANGNTLSTFGRRNNNADKNSRIVEVTADKQRVWDLEVENKWGWYRSDRLVDPPAGYVVSE